MAYIEQFFSIVIATGTAVKSETPFQTQKHKAFAEQTTQWELN
jgi:hypothetical protein